MHGGGGVETKQEEASIQVDNVAVDGPVER
jgi:hypothetical protein